MKLDWNRGFGGEVPRLHNKAGDLHSAEIAQNVLLHKGTLKPFSKPKKILDYDCPRKISFVNCCVLADTSECASFAVGPDLCNRVFATGLCGYPYPVTAKIPLCGSVEVAAPDWVRLGVPRPKQPIRFTVPPLSSPESSGSPFDCDTYQAPPYDPRGSFDPITGETLDEAFCSEIDPDGDGVFTVNTQASTPTASPNAGRQLKRECRDYIYTYVNSCGEESAPSCPSPDIGDADVDAPANLTIPPKPTLGDWDIVGIRVYRLMSGNVDGEWTNNEACHLFVAEIDATSAGPYNFMDDVEPCNLGEPTSTRHVEAPNECLEGIIHLEHGALAGFIGKDLYISEPFEYHAWGNCLNLDHDIVAIKEVHNQIYVATTGHPYTIASQPNEFKDRVARTVFAHNEPAPIYNKCSMAETANGVIWATDDGLVRLTGTSMSLITNEFAECDWLCKRPEQMIGATHNGRYYGFNHSGGFVYDYTDGIYPDGDVGLGSRLTTLTYAPCSVAVSEQGLLYLGFEDGLYQWNAGDEYEKYLWRSKRINVRQKLRWSVARLCFDGERHCEPFCYVTFRLYDENCCLVAECKIDNEKPFRLPRHPRGNVFYVEFCGTTPVSGLEMATSMADLVA